MKDKEYIFRHQAVALNYIEGPDNGPDILLLHGGCSRWQSFIPIISELMMNLHVYAIDLRGHGKSHFTTSYKINDYVDDVASFIKNYIKKPTIIFGNSFGGMIAIMLAAYYPELARAIIIGDAPIAIESLSRLVDTQRDLAHQVIHWLHTDQIENIYKELRDDYFAESLSQCDPNMLIAMFDQFDVTFEEYVTDKLFPLIKCPVLIIHGNPEKGSLITDTHINQASKLLSHMSHVQLSDLGHSIMEDKSSVLNEIQLFINKLTY